MNLLSHETPISGEFDDNLKEKEWKKIEKKRKRRKKEKEKEKEKHLLFWFWGAVFEAIVDYINRLSADTLNRSNFLFPVRSDSHFLLKLLKWKIFDASSVSFPLAVETTNSLTM